MTDVTPWPPDNRTLREKVEAQVEAIKKRHRDDGEPKCAWCFQKLDPHAADRRCTECRELHSSNGFAVGEYIVDTRQNEHIRPPEGGMDYSHFIFPLKDLDKRVTDLEDAKPKNQPYSGKTVFAIGYVLGLGIGFGIGVNW